MFYFLVSKNLMTSSKFSSPQIKVDFRKINSFCRDVFEIHTPNPNVSSELTKVAVNVIQKSKMNRRYLIIEAYAALVLEGLSFVKDVDPFQGINKSNITIHRVSLNEKNCYSNDLKAKL